MATPDPARSVSWGRTPHRAFLMVVSIGVLLYSLAVLLVVAWMGDIGVRCFFGNDLKESVSADYQWMSRYPVQGDSILSIGSTKIANYADYIRAIRGLSRLVDKPIEVTWKDGVTRE